MKVKVLQKSANELKIEVEGASHAICNLLQKRLLEDADVDLAGYDVPHPLASNPIIYVRTKGDVKPDAALRKAIEKAEEMNKDFGKELKVALRKA
jgi:DNA-directed RNA polymerase subunit L